MGRFLLENNKEKRNSSVTTAFVPPISTTPKENKPFLEGFKAISKGVGFIKRFAKRE